MGLQDTHTTRNILKNGLIYVCVMFTIRQPYKWRNNQLSEHFFQNILIGGTHYIALDSAYYHTFHEKCSSHTTNKAYFGALIK